MQGRILKRISTIMIAIIIVIGVIPFNSFEVSAAKINLYWGCRFS